MYRSPPVHKTYSDSQIQSVGTDSHTENITIRGEKRRRLSGDEIDDLVTFKIEIKEMITSMFEDMITNQNTRLDSIEKSISRVETNICTLQSSQTEIEKSLIFLTDQLDTIQSNIDRTTSDLKNISEKVSVQEEKIDAIDRNFRKTCVEIRKVPKSPGETKEAQYALASNLLKNLEIDQNQGDIRDVFRIPTRKNPEESTMVIEFSNTLIKNKLLKQIKKLSKNIPSTKLSTSCLGLSSPHSPIYVSDFLSPKERRLYYLAKEFSKSEDYKFCWISNNRIFLRKKEGAPFFVIKNEIQLQELKSKK